ncbi:MAG: heme lyase CcmF/NrfE family subunit [Pseudomonadota bacterium]
MIAEFGHFLLYVALVAALLQVILPTLGIVRHNQNLMAVAEPAALVQALMVLGAFLVLTYAFVTSDFSIRIVAANSHSLKPMLYKVSGVWGNHEGSMLLWILILAFYGALVALFGTNLNAQLRARVLAVQASISIAFLLFLILTSNPFERLDTPPLDGNDLNPLLQDPGLAFHPPFLYLGYVGLSMTFSFAIAALWAGEVDAAWARWVRPWALLSWVTLTIGIALGSWWAYYELGWGGWWFWDPVENASFMPWLIATALLHSAIVVEKRELLKSWTVLLAILAFSFSLIGTFIVRSGVITSVHAFANDPERGVYILLILLIFTGGGLSLYAVRAQSLRARSGFAFVSRENGLVLNNLLLVASCCVVFLGTIWPLIAELVTGRKLSVGAPFFDLTFTPFMLLLALALPLAAILPWKRGDLRKSIRHQRGAMALAGAIGLLIFSLQSGIAYLAPIGIALAAWLIFGTLKEVADRIQLFKQPIGIAMRRLANLPRADLGKLVGHFGLGLLFFGISAITAWEREDVRVAQIGERFELAGYEFQLDRLEPFSGPNYNAEIGTVTAYRNGRPVAVIKPEKRFYPVQSMSTTEAGISTNLARDLYLALGDRQGEGIVLRTFVKPFAVWLWIGSAVMALGGFISLTDRRFRLGVSRRKPAKAAVPAE